MKFEIYEEKKVPFAIQITDPATQHQTTTDLGKGKCVDGLGFVD